MTALNFGLLSDKVKNGHRRCKSRIWRLVLSSSFCAAISMSFVTTFFSPISKFQVDEYNADI